MKKTILSLLIGATFCLPLVGFMQNNQDIDSFLSSLMGGLGSTDTTFGFAATDVPTLREQTTSTVQVVFPVISKGAEKIKKYEVSASTISAADFSNPNIDYDKADFKVAEFTYTDTEVAGSSLNATMTGLDLVGKKYYISVTPISSANTRGNATKEASAGSGASTTTAVTTDAHGAGANMTMANTSYSQDGLKINLTWTPLNGADTVEIYYGKIGADLVSVGTATMSAGTFTFTVPESDTYIVRLQPLQGGSTVGTEVRLTIHMIDGTTTTTTTTTTNGTTTIHNNIPATGPEDYIFPILGTSLIVYFFYKKRFAHR